MHRDDLIAAAAKEKSQMEDSVADRLVEDKKYRELEELVVSRGDESSAMDLLVIYHRLARHQDVIDLLDRFASWNEPDLRKLRDPYLIGREESVCYMAAKAFIATGDRDMGLKILRRSFQDRIESPRAYDLFARTLGVSAVIPELKLLAEQDPLDPEPHLCQAKILLQAGNAMGAEIEIARALEIDPMLGSDPIASFGLKAEVESALGKKEDSKSTKAIIESFKLCERAETYFDANLKNTGMRLLKEAIDLDPNAFYPHARLAIESLKLSRKDDAKIHFHRAFELMPSSFGRKTGPSWRIDYQLFQSDLARNVANEVFSQMLVKEPANPRLNFQMGNLRLIQGNSDEAAKHFLRTIASDRLYFQALSQLAALDISPQFSEAQKLEVIRRQMKLNSGGKYDEYHNYYIGTGNLNPKSVYEAYREFKSGPGLFEPLYPLLETIRAREERRNGYILEASRDEERLPGHHLFSTEIMRELKLLLDEKEDGDE